MRLFLKRHICVVAAVCGLTLALSSALQAQQSEPLNIIGMTPDIERSANL